MSKVIAARYARALFETTESSGISSKVKQDMDGFVELQAESPEFVRLLHDPVIPVEVKTQALQACLQGKVQTQTLTFLYFLVEKKRLSLLPLVAAVYIDLYLDSQGQLPALIVSKYPLSKSQVDKIKDRFQNITGKEILPEMKIDPGLLGGFRVGIRNEIYDHTVEAKLLKFRRAIVNK